MASITGRDITNAVNNELMVVLGVRARGPDDRPALPGGNQTFHNILESFIVTHNIHQHRDALTANQVKKFLHEEMGVVQQDQFKAPGFIHLDGNLEWKFFGTKNLNLGNYDTTEMWEITNYKALVVKVVSCSGAFVTAVRKARSIQTLAARGRAAKPAAARVSIDETIPQNPAADFVTYQSIGEFFKMNIDSGVVWECRGAINESINKFKRQKGNEEKTDEDWSVEWAKRLRHKDPAAVMDGKRMVVLWYYLKFLYIGMIDSNRSDFTPEKVLEVIGAHKLKGTFKICLPMERAKVRYNVSIEPGSVHPHGEHWFSEADLIMANAEDLDETSLRPSFLGNLKGRTTTIEPWVVAFIGMSIFRLSEAFNPLLEPQGDSGCQPNNPRYNNYMTEQEVRLTRLYSR